MIKNILLFLSILGLGCNTSASDKEIEIVGHIKNIPCSKVYLANAYHWETFLDSATVRNDSFRFKLKVPPSFEPYHASISYVDMNGRVRTLGYTNYMLTTDKQVYVHHSFVLEPGITKITGDMICFGEGDDYYCKGLQIKTGKETDVMYKHQMTGFGMLGTADSARRSAIIKRYRQEITAYPMAYTLLQDIYNAKEEYTDKELGELVALFNKDVQRSETAGKLKKFISTRANFKGERSVLTASDTAGIKKSWLAPSSRFNLLVFWASWCGPCRNEIPALKKIRARFNEKDVHMISISIDKNGADWMQAVRYEAMPWEQVKVDSMEINHVKAGFNFSAIPLTVVTDRAGKEIKRYAGFNGNTETELSLLFEELLKQ
nr:TlpA disulfide reductase family protein [uncultured Chitinophaga sp.]